MTGTPAVPYPSKENVMATPLDLSTVDADLYEIRDCYDPEMPGSRWTGDALRVADRLRAEVERLRAEASRALDAIVAGYPDMPAAIAAGVTSDFHAWTLGALTFAEEGTT